MLFGFWPFLCGTLSPVIRTCGGICVVSSRPRPPCTLLGGVKCVESTLNTLSASSKPTTEFAQPPLSRAWCQQNSESVKFYRNSDLKHLFCKATFYMFKMSPPEFIYVRLFFTYSEITAQNQHLCMSSFWPEWCVCSYLAGHEDAGVVTGHIGTNTPKFVPPRRGRPRFDPTQTGLCKFGLELADPLGTLPNFIFLLYFFVGSVGTESGLWKRCFWKTVFLSPTENRWFWRKMAKMTIYILPTKTRGCASQSPEADDNDENGGCPSDKTRVFQKQGFRHPDRRSLVILRFCLKTKQKNPRKGSTG